jgi:hypothetical protein
MKFPNMDSFLYNGRDRSATKVPNRMSNDELRNSIIFMVFFLIIDPPASGS